ncbi:MAG TPA: S4 domain-containing protein, partial [Parafilimonas sp.]
MNTDDEIIKEETGEELYERKAFKVDAGQEPMRIDKWVQHRIENASRNKVQQAIEAGFLTVNGNPVKNNYKVKADDVIILLSLINAEYTEVKPENI